MDRYDLHTHTTCSDGSLSPSELLQMAKEKGLKGLSITDHDTMEAYNDALFSEAKSLDLTLITGVEISCRTRSTDVHILGYNIDTESPSLRDFLKRVQKIRSTRNEKILEKFKEQGILLLQRELEEVAEGMGKKIIGRPHIAYLLMKKGYVQSIREAFDRYLKDRGVCWVPSPKVSPMEAIHAIHLAGGKAIIAHPFFINSSRAVRELLEMPFDGIEGYYAKMPPDQEEKWVKIGKEKNWIITGGSDFHGAFKPQIPLGASWVTHSTVEKLLA